MIKESHVVVQQESESETQSGCCKAAGIDITLAHWGISGSESSEVNCPQAIL